MTNLRGFAVISLSDDARANKYQQKNMVYMHNTCSHSCVISVLWSVNLELSAHGGYTALTELKAKHSSFFYVCSVFYNDER